MIVVYDPVGVVARYDHELRRFRCEYHEDWETFTDRAPVSVAAIVVVHDELNGVPPGGSSTERRQAADARLRALVRTLGSIPIVVVRGPGLDYTRLRRAGVDCVLPHTKLDRLPSLLDDLLSESARLRLADAVEEADYIGVPELVRLAFARSLRPTGPPRTCSRFADLVQKADDTLRDILEHSPAGRAGLMPKWFVDAAILVHASELAVRHATQLAGATHLGVSESRLVRRAGVVSGINANGRT